MINKQSHFQAQSLVMTNLKYDISHIDRKLLRFLKYTHSGHHSDDLILLALVQSYGDVIFDNILMSQQEVHDIFDKYEAPDGTRTSIKKGQRQYFAYAVLYAQYRYSQIQTDKHTCDPSKWTETHYLNCSQRI